MKILVEKQPNCTATLRVEIPADKVQIERQKVAQSLASKAKVPGFRPGKAPRAVIEKRFNKEIEAESQETLINSALDEAIKYAKERQAFGRPISKFQAIQAKIADLSSQIEAARLLTWRAAIEKDRGENFSLTAAQAKLITGRLAVRASEEAVQIHGGYGYIEEYPVCRFYRDAKILTIGEGTDEVQQMVIARALGC